MKMGFLLKNTARRGMGEEGVLKKGEEKEYSKRERKRRQKTAFKIREFETGGPVGRNFANFEGWGKLCLKTSGLSTTLS